MIYSQLERPETKASPSGDKYLEVYQEEITSNGKELVYTGKKDIDAMIQEDVESTKIENIIAATQLGDFSMLRAEQPIYVDATTLPKNLMEASNIVLKATQEFNKFPAEVKRLFDNNPDKYLAEMGTKEFFEKMSPYNEKIAKIEEAGNLKKYNDMVAKEAKFQKDVEAAKGGTTE